MPHRGVGEGDPPATRDAAAGRRAYADVTRSALQACGILRGSAARTEPRVTDSLLREFMTLLEAAQNELDQRWNRQGNPGCRADHV
ncbi:hypothetical protein [Streptomyces sp. NPDC002132]|uniref:hypothetical protein n=1 Tax=unclassified Streptomyces TaxID=2593676 RepID=UPI003327FA1A